MFGNTHTSQEPRDYGSKGKWFGRRQKGKEGPVMKQLHVYEVLFLAAVLVAGIQPALAQVVLEPGFEVEKLADISLAAAMAIPPAGSPFGNYLYVSAGPQDLAPEPPDPIYRVNLENGEVEIFFELPGESWPCHMTFGPGDPYTHNLYISSNNRDGGRSGDQGGSIVYLEPDPSINGELFLTPPPESTLPVLTQPRDLHFGPGGAFGTGLIVNNTTDHPFDFAVISPTGERSTLFTSPVFTDVVEFGPGGGYGTNLYTMDWYYGGQNRVYCVDGSGTFTTFAVIPNTGSRINLHALRFAPPGPFGQQLYVAAVIDGESFIFRVDDEGNVGEFARGFVCIWMNGLVFSNDGATLFVLDRGANAVYRICGNQPPTADAGPDVTIHWTAQDSTVIQGQAFDPDPDTSLTYRWLDESNVVLLDWTPVGPAGEADLDLSILPPFPICSTELYLEVSDGLATTADDMDLRVTNSAPGADAGGNVMITTSEQGGTVLTSVASDNDGDALTYRWLDLTGPEPTVLLDWTPVGPGGEAPLDLSSLGPLSVGEYHLQLEVWDGQELAQDTMVLTIGNSPPEPAITGGGTYQQWDPIIVGGAISDFDGDLVDWEILEGSFVQASGQIQTVAGGDPVDIPGVGLGLMAPGVHELVLTADDGVNQTVSQPCFVTVVLDEDQPTLAPEPSVTQLWPPNHMMVPVTIAVNAYDNSPYPVQIAASVTSDAPANDSGDGNTEPDWIIDGIEDGPGGFVYLQLRAERQGKGDGRTYTVTIVATDVNGNSSSAQVQIIAPHDKGKR